MSFASAEAVAVASPLPSRAGHVPERRLTESRARTDLEAPAEQGFLFGPDPPPTAKGTPRMTTTILVPEKTTDPISTRDLRDLLSDPDTTVVDVRPLAAYNGWRLDGETRGGHIPGAVSFPSAWLTSVDAPEIQRILAEKGVLASGRVVVYGAGNDDAEAVATALAALGVESIRVFRDGFRA